MAIFCTNCGASMDDASVFCTNCGASVEPAAPQAHAPNQAPLNPQTPLNPQATYAAKPAAPVRTPAANKPDNAIQAFIDKVKADPKKFLIPVAAVIGVILVAVLLVTLLSGSGYKGAIDDYFQAKLGDKDALEASVPEEVWEAYRKDDDMSKSEFSDYLKDAAKGLKDSAKETLGKDIEIEYEIEEAEKMDKDDLEEIEEYFDDELDVKLKVSKGYELEGKYKLKGDDGKEKNDMEIVALKIDGKWYLATMGKSGKNIYVTFLGTSLASSGYYYYRWN